MEWQTIPWNESKLKISGHDTAFFFWANTCLTEIGHLCDKHLGDIRISSIYLGKPSNWHVLRATVIQLMVTSKWWLPSSPSSRWTAKSLASGLIRTRDPLRYCSIRHRREERALKVRFSHSKVCWIYIGGGIESKPPFTPKLYFFTMPPSNSIRLLQFSPFLKKIIFKIPILLFIIVRVESGIS